MRAFAFGFVGLAMLLSANGIAAGTEVFVDDSYGDFAGGDVTTTTLVTEGFLEPPLRRERIAAVDADILWSAVRTGTGTIFLSAGHRGSIHRIEKGKLVSVASFDDPGIYALALDRKGALLAGLSPSGEVRRIDGDATPTLVAESGARFVWEIAPQEDGSLLLACGGDAAAVVRVKADGTTESVSLLKEATNGLDLLRTSNGDLLLATQGPGYVARIANDGQTFVLVDSELEEVRRLAEGAGGTVYAAVNGKRAPGERFLRPAGADNKEKPRDSSMILEIRRNGFVSEFWTSPESPIHDMVVAPDGSLLVAAGSKGQLYRIAADGRTAASLGSIGAGVVTRILPQDAGPWLLTTADEAAVYEFSPKERMAGRFVSRAFGASATASWGRIRVDAEPSTADKLRVRTRSGNTAKASDALWSAWSDPLPLVDGTVAVQSAPSRFFQYAIDFPEGTPEARVDSVRIFYAEANQPPRLLSLEVNPVAPPKREGTAPPVKANSTAKSGPVTASPESNSRILELKWRGEDPNGDALRYSVELQAIGTNRWLPLFESIEGTSAKVDTAGIADGRYRFRVRATDALANAPGNEGFAELVSIPVAVDSLPPAIAAFSARAEGPQVTVTLRAEDSTTNVAAAWCRIDLGDWRPMAFADGVADSRAESLLAKFSRAEAPAGATLSVMVVDDAGNASQQVAILE